MATGHTTRDDQELDKELAGLISVESFEPWDEFRSHATLNDPAIYQEADRDWQGWWAGEAEKLNWFEPWNQVLDVGQRDDDKPGVVEHRLSVYHERTGPLINYFGDRDMLREIAGNQSLDAVNDRFPASSMDYARGTRRD